TRAWLTRWTTARTPYLEASRLRLVVGRRRGVRLRRRGRLDRFALLRWRLRARRGVRLGVGTDRATATRGLVEAAGLEDQGRSDELALGGLAAAVTRVLDGRAEGLDAL